MPSKSIVQHNLMAMANNPKSRKKAKGKLPPISVAAEFMNADKTNKSYKKTARVKQKKSK